MLDIIGDSVAVGWVNDDIEVGLFFDFAKGGLDFGFAGFNVAFREVGEIILLMDYKNGLIPENDGAARFFVFHIVYYNMDRIGTSETADGVAVVASVVVGRVNVIRAEVQVVRLGAIVRCRRPITTLAAGVIQAAGIDEPTSKGCTRNVEIL